VDKAGRHFLGYELGRQLFVFSDMRSVDDAGPGGAGLYTIRTALPPAALTVGWHFGTRVGGVDYAYLSRRQRSAVQEEADYGLSVALLAIGAEFAYNNQRLADALKR
jgi:hypothetical protein